MELKKLFKKGFRIHLVEKPKSKEEIFSIIDEYQKDRDESYRYFSEDGQLMLERNKLIYTINLLEAEKLFTFPSLYIGTKKGTWFIDVTKVD